MNVIGRDRATSPGTELIDTLAALRLADLPAEMHAKAKLALLDCLGCGIFGTQFEWARITRDYAEDAATGPATILGRKGGASPVAAALANGTAIHAFELDDLILGALIHAGATVVPAALAVAEATGAPGERVVLAIIAGYELIARMGRAFGPGPVAQGFHPTSLAGPAGAALAAGIVAGASREAIGNAIGIAASTASGLKAFQQGTGGMVKRLHGGLGASNGVLAWELASRGFTGPARALDGKFGMMEVFAAATGRPEDLAEGLGENWAIGRNWIKLFPSCGVIHTSTEALEDLRAEGGLSPGDVAEVRIGVSQRVVAQNGATDPQDPMAAQYSLPYCAALALAADARDPNAFLPENLGDPVVRALIPRIVLHVDPEVDARYPDAFGAKVELRTTDGRSLRRTVWTAHGSTAEDPWTAEELLAKFRKLVTGRIGAAAAEAIIAAVDTLDTSPDVSTLSAALRASAG